MSSTPLVDVTRRPPALVLADGSVEALKWVAVAMMSGDHVNKYLFNATLPVLSEAGRLALPLFVIVMAYNLARPNAYERGVHIRALKHLALFGLVASIPFIALNHLYFGGWYPLNVLFTLFVFTTTVALLETHRSSKFFAAGIVFLIGGGVVEFWWPAITLGLASWFYFKQPSWLAAVSILASCYSLSIINGNHWALASLPVVVAATTVDLRVPRLRWFFYAFYPLHLTALWLIRIPMRKAGFLFF